SQFCDEILTLNKHNKRIEIQGGKRIVEDVEVIDEEILEQIVKK
ncbi:replication protein A, partial [Pseudoalteromonas ruthenica]